MGSWGLPRKPTCPPVQPTPDSTIFISVTNVILHMLGQAHEENIWKHTLEKSQNLRSPQRVLVQKTLILPSLHWNSAMIIIRGVLSQISMYKHHSNTYSTNTIIHTFILKCLLGVTPCESNYVISDPLKLWISH